MPRVTLAPIDGNAYGRAMGQRPEILKKWFELDEQIRFTGRLSPTLKEEVRRSLAPEVGCVFCASLGAPRTDEAARRESLAVAYAQLLREPKTVDDSTFEVLREEFTDEEIVELTCWALFMIAAQGFGAVMRIGPATDDEVAVYDEWRRTGEEAAARA